MNGNIRKRLDALKAHTAAQGPSVGIVAMLAPGVWAASRHGGATRTFTTQAEAEAALKAAHCDPVIIIDLERG